MEDPSLGPLPLSRFAGRISLPGNTLRYFLLILHSVKLCLLHSAHVGLLRWRGGKVDVFHPPGRSAVPVGKGLRLCLNWLTWLTLGRVQGRAEDRGAGVAGGHVSRAGIGKPKQGKGQSGEKSY